MALCRRDWQRSMSSLVREIADLRADAARLPDGLLRESRLARAANLERIIRVRRGSDKFR